MNKPSSNSHQASLFGELGTMLKSKHPLLRLAQMVDWSLIEQSFTPHFCADKGRLPQPIRLMTGCADLTLKESIRINLAIEDRKIRTVWDDEQEKWYFSIVDVVGALVDSKDYQTARKYWNKLKQRLKEEGFEPVTNCHQLKLRAEDGKLRLTDVADTEQLFRIIQSVPSPKAEPINITSYARTFKGSMDVRR